MIWCRGNQKCWNNVLQVVFEVSRRAREALEDWPCSWVRFKYEAGSKSKRQHIQHNWAKPHNECNVDYIEEKWSKLVLTHLTNSINSKFMILFSYGILIFKFLVFIFKLTRSVITLFLRLLLTHSLVYRMKFMWVSHFKNRSNVKWWHLHMFYPIEEWVKRVAPNISLK